MKKLKPNLGQMLVVICMLLFAKTTLLAQGIPPITDLSATPGPGPGQVTLRWNTPMFDNPTTDQPFDYSYEFRHSDVQIDASNWDAAATSQGKIAPIVAFCADVHLDLWVTPYVEKGWIYRLDAQTLKAWLTIQFHCFHFYFPGAVGLANETIHFEGYYPDVDGELVFSDSDTTDKHGMAEVHTPDLYDDPQGIGQCSEEKFLFKAFWQGHSVGGSAGQIIISGDKEDSESIYLCDYNEAPPPPDHWNGVGGVYGGNLEGVTFQFTVPAKALLETGDIPVMLSTPMSVPPPIGMNLGVPGPMVPFQLEKMIGDPYLLGNPIVISMTYPADKLTQYGGLGESSLRGYRYDFLAGQWQLQDKLPLKLNRTEHRISFETERLGLFAIAAETDSDSDGMGDYEKFHYGTNPGLADSDADGISDGNEIWFTGGDPLDPRKLDGDDQYAIISLPPGQGYYIAARIVGAGGQSPVSNCVYIASTCPAVPDLNCDGIINFKDVAVIANRWLQAWP